MKTQEIKCKYCEIVFDVETRELKRGNGKYCSRSCCGKAKKGHRTKTPNVTCAFCGTAFYKNASKRKNSKSNLYFCCRNHKDKAQRIGGLSEIQPGHYNTGTSRYRQIAFRNHEHKCNKCSYDFKPVLIVHHMNRNRCDNRPENLEILCPTCHAETHYRAKEMDHFINLVEPRGNAPRTRLCKSPDQPSGGPEIWYPRQDSNLHATRTACLE